ncbi:MAG: TRAP transporter small permease [Elusimicrobia bacterium]|nr:TRAP transporter small permease [Elusimicrobiota bacterium]
MERIRKAESVLLGLQSAVLVAVLLFLVVMSFLQVALRQLFGGGFLWCDTLLRHLVLWVGFLGAARAAAEEKHFAFEALTEHLPARLHGPAAAAARLAAVAVSLLLAEASWSFMLEERASGAALFTAGELTVPAWPFAAILPIGFLLAALHTGLRLWLAKVPEEASPR